MTKLDRLEHIFFDDAPTALRQFAVMIVALAAVGGLALGSTAQDGFSLKHMWIAAYALIPATLAWLLSIAIAKRHIATVPLIAILCALSAYIFIRDPREVAEGISPYMLTLIGTSVVMILEAVAIFAVLWFTVHLWRKGAFK